MERVRKPFEGVSNIIRFNWHFYAFGFALTVIIIILNFFLPAKLLLYINIALVFGVIITMVSLAVSFYVYDRSELYQLMWLDDLEFCKGATVLNIHAGFDEISGIISKKCSATKLKVYDFYDPEKHTEISIKRARLHYPSFPGTKSISTTKIPELNNSIDICILFMSAHEIRNENETVEFFKELNRVLHNEGKIVITEHLRDLPNFFAYSIGFFHFHSKRRWLQVFKEAGLNIQRELKTTPFISTFILTKHGSSS